MSNEKLVTTSPEAESDIQASGNTQQTPPSEKSAEIAHNYWLMSQPFKRGKFYELLKELKNDNREFVYDCVLALDFGAGQTAACALFAEHLKISAGEKFGEWFTAKFEPDKYKLDPDKYLNFSTIKLDFVDSTASVIPTMIGFKDGEVIIGKDAKNADEFYQHFKRYPGEKSENGELTGNWSDPASDSKTYKDLMLDYFREVFRQIIYGNDPRIKESLVKGKMLICVGCPTSKEWLGSESQKKFKNLIRKAVEPVCREVAQETESKNKAEIHVAVVAESTASLMTGMLSSNYTRSKYINKETDIGKGILIVDMGSLTIDVSYIKAGSIIITDSITLGGYEVDERILNAALEMLKISRGDLEKYGADNGINNYAEKCLIKMRELKEIFYDSGRTHADDGSVSGKSFNFNKNFMDNEVWGKDKDDDHPGQLLLERLRSFINKFYTAVKDYGCDTVIVSGGTGKVDEFREVIESVFHESDFIPYENTSLCVAEGLCLMKKIEYTGQLYLEKYINATKVLAINQYKETMKNASKMLAPIVTDNIKYVTEALIKNDKTVTDKEFINEVEKTIIKTPEYSNCMDKISKAMVPCLNEFKTKCRIEAAKVADGIYKKDFSFVVNPSDSVTIVKNDSKSPYEIAVRQALVNLIFNRIIILITAKGTKYLGKVVESSIIRIPTYSHKKFVQDKLMNARDKLGYDISPKKLSEFLVKLYSSDYLKDLETDLNTELQEGFYYTEIESYFELNAEAVLGKVMLQVYDSPPKEL